MQDGSFCRWSLASPEDIHYLFGTQSEFDWRWLCQIWLAATGYSLIEGREYVARNAKTASVGVFQFCAKI